ncbi:MAG: hypothetical protein ACYTG1_12240, partial [Planctomycetota bacterium]
MPSSNDTSAPRHRPRPPVEWPPPAAGTRRARPAHQEVSSDPPPAEPHLLVCHLPTLDRRWLDPDVTPHVHRMLAEYPAAALRTLPFTDPFATLATGTYPATHGIWQVSLKRDRRDTWRDRVLDHVPDLLSTTWQCLRHFVDRTFELPAMPRRRRRHFNLHRLKFANRGSRGLPVDVIGGVPSVFGVLGERARYSKARRFEAIPDLLARLPDPGRTLEVLEFHALDFAAHWNLDRPDLMADYLRRSDEFVGALHERCREQGVAFMLVVDHGQERVRGGIPLARHLKAAGVPAREYH